MDRNITTPKKKTRNHQVVSSQLVAESTWVNTSYLSTLRRKGLRGHTLKGKQSCMAGYPCAIEKDKQCCETKFPM
jgi:hypothetical protein